MSQEDAPNFRRIDIKECCDNCINNIALLVEEIQCRKHNVTIYKDDHVHHVCDSWAGDGDE